MSTFDRREENGRTVWLSRESGEFETFLTHVKRRSALSDFEHAIDVQGNVPIYEGAALSAVAVDETARRDLTAEWCQVLDDGPGIIVIRNAVQDISTIDRATQVFEQIIHEQRKTGAGAGDHFAKPGANDRIWNAIQKHCIADPQGFADYYASDAIAMACEAWLGVGYQITSQVNRVNPGGGAQKPHRDYHLGFMTPEQMAKYPAHIHGVSPLLTLQGAVAHCDMPVESGPTLFLPYSQLFFEGYLAFGRDEYQDYFTQHHIQLPLNKGDAVFFNPAVMHGAGANKTSDIYRMANLLQISSAFGRAMESVDRASMARAVFPELANAVEQKKYGATELQNIIAATAEGYAFPTNLDLDPPVGGLAPKTQAEIMTEALQGQVSPEAFAKLIEVHKSKRGQ